MDGYFGIEGPEACGKDTVIPLVQEALSDWGFEVVVVREPGGTQLGEQLRTILKDPNVRITPLAMALLMNAARAQLLNDVVAPACRAGKIVLSGRTSLSTRVYQSHAEGVDIADVKAIERIVLRKLSPQKTFVIIISQEEMMRRLNERGGREKDRYDSQGLKFHKAILQAYREELQLDPTHIMRIEGERPPRDVALDIAKNIARSVPHIQIQY